MEIIDADWLKARLTQRGDKAAMARAIGLKPKQISEILSGARAVKQEEVAPILRFFGERAPDPTEMVERIAGFSESSAEPIQHKAGTPADTIMRLARTTTEHPTLYRATRDVPGAHIRRHDMLIIDMKAKPAPGDAVICTIVDPETGRGGTHVRRWLPPWLVAGDEVISTDDPAGRAALLGRIAGVVRGAFTGAD